MSCSTKFVILSPLAKTIKKKKAPCDPVQVKILAINCSTMAEAEQSLPKLPHLITRHKEVAAAWQRGRFLRNLRNLASVAVTVDEAARRLELADPDELHHMIEDDSEVRDTWCQTRQEAVIRIKLALAKTAFEGNQAAIRAVETLLRTEVPVKMPDTRKLRVADIAIFTGKPRATIYEWINKGHLPIAADKTIDVGSFIRWFEIYITDNMIQKYASKKTDQDSRLHQLKAEQIERELKRDRHELLPREEFIAGILARHRLLINTMRQKAPQMAQLCQGQKPERVIEIITDCLGDICRELCHVPAEFYLSDPAAKAYQKVLEILKDDFNEKQD